MEIKNRKVPQIVIHSSGTPSKEHCFMELCCNAIMLRKCTNVHGSNTLANKDLHSEALKQDSKETSLTSWFLLSPQSGKKQCHY